MEKNITRIDGETCIIKTFTPKTGHLEFLVDKEDFNRIKNFKWVPHRDKSGSFYLFSTFRMFENGKTRKTQIQLHRLIMSFPEGVVDHKDGNTLDNRKINLRAATVEQNTFNRGINKKSKLGTKGITLDRSSGKYRAYIQPGGKCLWLGTFEKLSDACLAYNRAAVEHFGQFARLNEV